jgi:chromosome segregation protein
VITHNKNTARGARTLVGITMEESGVSKKIDVRLPDNEDDPVTFVPDLDRSPFEEEDVEPEAGLYIPPRPPRRENLQRDDEG